MRSMFYNIRITYDDDRHSGTDERPDSTVSHRQPATIKYIVLVPFYRLFLILYRYFKAACILFFLKYIWNLIVKHSSNSLRLIRHTKKLHYNTSKPEIKNT